MEASPEKIWALISDVTQIGRFSPETLEAEWLDGAAGPAVGAKFRGHVKRNQRGPMYWTTCKVTECDENRVFEFAVVMRDSAVNTWRYDLEPSGTGTDVTESFRLDNNLFSKIYWMLLGWARGKTNREDMRTTLERIKKEVE